MDYKTEIGMKFVNDADLVYSEFKNGLLDYIDEIDSLPKDARLSIERNLSTKAAKACELYLKGILLPNYSIKNGLVDSNLIDEITVKQEVELILGSKTPQDILQEVNAIKMINNEPKINFQKGEPSRIKEQSFKKKFSHNLYDLLKELPNVASIIQDDDFKNYAKSLGVTQTNNQNFLEIFCKKMRRIQTKPS